jgi:hypothetical protein
MFPDNNRKIPNINRKEMEDPDEGLISPIGGRHRACLHM